MGVMEASLSGRSQQRKRQRTEALDRVRDWLQVADAAEAPGGAEQSQEAEQQEQQEQQQQQAAGPS